MESESNPNQVAPAILRGAVRVVGFFAQHDKDDKLGQTTIDIPVGVPGTEIKEWNFSGRTLGGFLGWSTWNYTNRRMRLIHVNTNHALHSHFGFSHPNWTASQQEVTGFAGRDDNDWWSLFEIH